MSHNPHLDRLPPASTLQYIVSQWFRCEEMIGRAVARGEGAFDLNHVWDELISNKCQLWPGVKAAIVTRIETHPSGMRSCLFWLAGGDDLDELARMEAALADWAKSMGCNRVEIVGRKGWLRALPGYRESSTVLVKDL